MPVPFTLDSLRPFILISLHLLAGIMGGTALSFHLNGIPLAELYLEVLLSSPVYLTLLLPLEFIHGNVWIGIATIIGIISVIVCLLMGLAGRNQWRWRIGAAVGGILWSLGSAFAMSISYSA